MDKYEMDPTRTLGATERTQDAGQMDGRTDRQTDGRSETNIPAQQLPCAGGIIMHMTYDSNCQEPLLYQYGDANQAALPLMILRNNSKFDENIQIVIV